MQRESVGSAVLLVVTLMAILSVLLLTTMQGGTFLRMLIGQQIVCEQQISLNQGLLSYAVGQAKKHYGSLTQTQEAVELEFLLDEGIGWVSLNGSPDGVAIASELRKGLAPVCHASCRLTKNSDNKFIIQCFQR